MEDVRRISFQRCRATNVVTNHCKVKGKSEQLIAAVRFALVPGRREWNRNFPAMALVCDPGHEFLQHVRVVNKTWGSISVTGAAGAAARI